MKDTFVNRLLVNVLGIPGILLLIWLGGIYFACFMTIVMLIALWEFYNINRKQGHSPLFWIGYLATLAIALGYYLWRPGIPVWFILGGFIVVVTTLLSEMYRNNPNPTRNIAITLAGIIYIPILLGSLIVIRNWDQTIGSHMTYSVFISVWICDSAAYMFGKLWGKTKMLERVSPKKTIIGCIGGVAGAVITYLVIFYTGFLGGPFTFTDIVVLALITGVIGQAGDFAQSLVKRDMGVKDSGTLLMAHGGVFDRFDSLIFTGASALVYLHISHGII